MMNPIIMTCFIITIIVTWGLLVISMPGWKETESRLVRSQVHIVIEAPGMATRSG